MPPPRPLQILEIPRETLPAAPASARLPRAPPFQSPESTPSLKSRAARLRLLGGGDAHGKQTLHRADPDRGRSVEYCSPEGPGLRGKARCGRNTTAPQPAGTPRRPPSGPAGGPPSTGLVAHHHHRHGEERESKRITHVGRRLTFAADGTVYVKTNSCLPKWISVERGGLRRGGSEPHLRAAEAPRSSGEQIQK